MNEYGEIGGKEENLADYNRIFFLRKDIDKDECR